MSKQWITWELFEDLYDLPARDFPERCDFKKCLIWVGAL